MVVVVVVVLVVVVVVVVVVAVVQMKLYPKLDSGTGSVTGWVKNNNCWFQ